MLREIGIRRALISLVVGMVAVTALLLLTGNEVIAFYGSLLIAGTVFTILFGRADRRGEIHRSADPPAAH